MKELLCIVCPNGCRLQVEASGEEANGEEGYRVRGNLCGKGADFARTEMTAPVRTLTTTVRTAFPAAPALPVRTAGEIPKEKIPAVMQFLAGITITKILGPGEIAAANVLGLGVDVIVTGSILKEEYDG